MREGVKLARRLGPTAPLGTSLSDEIFPGPGVATDEDIDGWLAKVASTEYHPVATCAMLPESKGGVVDAKLNVYGLGETPRGASTSRNLIGLRLISQCPGCRCFGISDRVFCPCELFFFSFCLYPL